MISNCRNQSNYDHILKYGTDQRRIGQTRGHWMLREQVLDHVFLLD